MIISPWGEIIAEAKKEPAVLLAELDMNIANEIRTRMPCLEHRRL